MVKYKDALSLGMKRVELDDVGFYDSFGYECFYLEKRLTMGTLYWYPDTQEVHLIVNESPHVVKGVKEAQLLISMYGRRRK